MVKRPHQVKFEKPDPAMVAYFDSMAPISKKGVERRQMFGFPCCFVNGNMFMGLHNNNMILRLSEIDRASLSSLGGKPFEPMPGRIMKEYVLVPDDLLRTANLAAWIERSLAFASRLPVKKKGSRKAKQR